MKYGFYSVKRPFMWRGRIIPVHAIRGHVMTEYLENTKIGHKWRYIKKRKEVEFFCIDFQYIDVSYNPYRRHYNIVVLDYQSGEWINTTTKEEAYSKIADIIDEYAEERGLDGIKLYAGDLSDTYIGCPHDRDPRRSFDLKLNVEYDWSSQVITDTDAVPHWLDGNTRKDYNVYKSSIKYTHAAEPHVSIAKKHETFYMNRVPVRGPHYPEF